MDRGRYTNAEEPEKGPAAAFPGDIRTLPEGASGGDEGRKMWLGRKVRRRRCQPRRDLVAVLGGGGGAR